MRTSAVTSGSYLPSNVYIQNKKSPVPSFKADVRIARGVRFDGETMPEEQARPLFQSLVHALSAYKDKGSDNILIYLKPVFTPGSWGKKAKSNIEILAVYKDPDKAIEEVKENIYKHPENVFKSTLREDAIKERIKLLENPSEDVRNQYKDVIFNQTAYSNTSLNKYDTVTPKILDATVDYIVSEMSYNLPYKPQDSSVSAPFVWRKKNPFIKPDTISPNEEDKIYEKLCANYPQWEKDLFDELKVDYKKEIKETGEIFPV